ncbi:MAG: hypothetical protein KatS3mg109_0620 [Pirellulaceae bacterium]|nr:MAG: hypothetical protein KatS3mg109_0620 [Pirellulaceae bacterium]
MPLCQKKVPDRPPDIDNFCSVAAWENWVKSRLVEFLHIRSGLLALAF